MKKICTLLSVLLLCFSVAGCSALLPAVLTPPADTPAKEAQEPQTEVDFEEEPENPEQSEEPENPEQSEEPENPEQSESSASSDFEQSIFSPEKKPQKEEEKKEESSKGYAKPKEPEKEDSNLHKSKEPAIRLPEIPLSGLADNELPPSLTD